MRAARLFRMGPAEMAGRSVQELRKRLDRRGLAARPYPVLGVLSALAPDAALDAIRARARAGDLDGAGALLLDRFLEGAPARFFEGAVSQDAPAVLRHRMREAEAAIVDEAESVLAGRFDLLGYRGLSFGDPIDWHLDPVSGKRAPLVHWSDIDFLDAGRVGDSKVIWELNRHQWLVRLGQAYRMTGDERYAERFAATIVGWTRANPAGMGINWASSLEVAFRIISWSWAVILFRGSPVLAPGLFVQILEMVARHAAHVERYLSRYYSPNTHLTGEALGLLYAGLVFPELRGARRWQRLGRRILAEEIDRQVLPDGFHFERATCYHRYTVEIYLHFVLLAARNDVPLPREIAARLEGMVDVLLALRQPDGSMPAIGDADGGSLLPLAPRQRDDLRGVFAVAAAVFRRPEYAWAAEGPGPEALWLCGPARASLQSPAARAPETSASALFAEGGYAVMRSGWDQRAHQLVFDTGPLGCPVSAGHGHADLLGIQCTVFGRPTIADPGTFCYTAQPEWRDFFRGTAAHSTVRVDGLDQVDSRGPFSWQARPGARLLRWLTTESLDVADAEHRAYARLADPVTHRRRVLWIKPRYWIVVDDLAGAASHAVELRFQFAPIEIAVGPALWARAHAATGPGLFVRPFSSAPFTAEVIAGETSPAVGWISRDYGQREPAPLLVYRSTARLPLRIATLLLPAEAGLPAPPDAAALRDDAGNVIGLCIHSGDGDETVRFDGPETLASRRA